MWCFCVVMMVGEMEDGEGKNFWNGRGVLDLGVKFAASTDGLCALILTLYCTLPKYVVVRSGGAVPLPVKQGWLFFFLVPNLAIHFAILGPLPKPQ